MSSKSLELGASSKAEAKFGQNKVKTGGVCGSRQCRPGDAVDGMPASKQ